MAVGFGWTLLTRDALRRAEAQLAEETKGVRDEIGFLLLHQGYADAFFPGTSVLHTRLRYVLFLPWLYQRLRHTPPGKAGIIDRLVADEEHRLTKRLPKARGEGVIGGGVLPNRSVQQPSQTYWTALNAWGLIRPDVTGRSWSRARLHQALLARRSRLDDDGHPIDDDSLPFVKLPPPPPVWETAEELTFTLEPAESLFLGDKLSAVEAGGGRLSLLSQLVRRHVDLLEVEHPWDPAVAAVAGRDRAVLERAQGAAALAAIGRAMYAARVEQLRNRDMGSASTRHQENLEEVIEAFRADAAGVDLHKVGEDLRLSGGVAWDAICQVQRYMARGGRPDDVHAAFETAERKRKPGRARLPNTPDGRARRREWNPEEHPLAEPLHYRWAQVRRLLLDLRDVGPA